MKILNSDAKQHLNHLNVISINWCIFPCNIVLTLAIATIDKRSAKRSIKIKLLKEQSNTTSTYMQNILTAVCKCKCVLLQCQHF